MGEAARPGNGGQWTASAAGADSGSNLAFPIPAPQPVRASGWEDTAKRWP